MVAILVKSIDCFKVGIDDDVEKCVQQETHAVGSEIRRQIPSLNDGGHREFIARTNRHQPAISDEYVDLLHVQLGLHGVAREEQVLFVAI